jgi:hypothetical protein
MQELIKALIKAKAEFNPIQKDGTNPHYKRKYATLDAVLDAVTPGLSKHGLVIIQTTEIFEGKTVLRTHIFHESGENITSTYPLPEIGDSQKFGAALTMPFVQFYQSRLMKIMMLKAQLLLKNLNSHRITLDPAKTINSLEFSHQNKL